MHNRRQVSANSRDYTIALDDAPPVAGRLWAVVRARLLDELTLRPVATPVRVETEHPGLRERATAGGIAGLSGIPFPLFSVPDLNWNTHRFDVTFSAQGYLPWGESVALGPVAGYPDRFAPVTLPDIHLHRDPLIVSGRIVRNGAPAIPLAGANISMTALWLQLPPASSSPPPDPYQPLSLAPGLYRARNSAAGRIRSIDLAPAPPVEDKQLRDAAPPGSTRLALSNRINLAAGNLVAIEPEDASIVEYILVATVGGSGTASEPGEIDLQYPLKHAHRRNVTVRRMTQQAPGAFNAIGIDAIRGDVCLLLNSFTDLATATTVEIRDGSNPDEYQRCRRFDVDADADGYYSFPPMSRIAQCNLRIDDGIAARNFNDFVPDYGRREQRRDFVL